MRAILLASAASVIGRAFMSDVCETVIVTRKGSSAKVRVNKSDYDRDQAEGGAKEMTLSKDEAEQSVASGVQAPAAWPEGMTPVAAPAAPDYSGGDDTSPVVKDPVKDAAAPTAPPANTRLVAQEGKGAKAKFFVVDGTGAKLAIDGVNPDGYATDGEAWQAILALPH